MKNKKNRNPIILIPGLLSFIKRKSGQFSYFGGTKDLLSQLNHRGTDIRLGYCGPFSSNWDRACEVFAYIKGGTVDYGESHSRRNGHNRFGKTYPGIFREWSPENPLHLAGYSMGIQTARILLHLLTFGNQEEKSVSKGGCSPLFKGGFGSVLSLTSLSGTHNGTTFSYYQGRSEKNDLISLAELFLLLIKPLPIYFDVELDHFLDLQRFSDESTRQYNQRIIRDIFRSNNHDLAFFDLTLEGAKIINEKYPLPKDIPLFSWAARATAPDTEREVEIPLNHVLNPILSSIGAFIGQYSGDVPGGFNIGPEWLPNDGVVNTYSQDGPHLGAGEPVNWDENIKKGCWNFLGVLEPFGHWGWQGITKTQETTFAPGSTYVELMEKVLHATLERYHQHRRTLELTEAG